MRRKLKHELRNKRREQSCAKVEAGNDSAEALLDMKTFSDKLSSLTTQ
jgi:hypothetical protein